LWHCTIGAEELSYFSSYQTLTLHIDWWTYEAPKKLVKSWRSWPPIAVKLFTA
jgi:hypothetical protein